MGKFYDSIPSTLIPWLLKQEMFWVATAPLSLEGHVNVSPKGIRGSFHIISPTQVWYQDLTGSGVETISHLRENGRITLLFHNFGGPPRIARLFGTGKVHEFGSPEYEALIPLKERRPSSRAAIVIDVHKVGTSCGYAVPYYEFKAHRQVLLDCFAKCELADQADPSAHAKHGMKAYWARNNLQSIDGLPGLVLAPAASRSPEFSDEMRRANPPEDEFWASRPADANGLPSGRGSKVLVKHGLERQRVQEWAVAFALGLMAAAIYVQAIDFAG
ncbi:hypothetical protein GY45DRAFT_1257340 [Cubamyces sp. BRFM 1775]|nr:hypothetical protein GY45DRAFT_1257340 [Cubamyces sp. BRFM 1775]